MHNEENTYHLWATWKGIQCTEVLKIHLSNNAGLRKSKILTYFSAQTCNSILRLQIKYSMTERLVTKASNVFRIFSFRIKIKKLEHVGKQENQI